MEAADCRSSKEITGTCHTPRDPEGDHDPAGPHVLHPDVHLGSLKVQTFLSRCGGLTSPALPESLPQDHTLSEKVCGSFCLTGQDSGNCRMQA